MKNEDDDDDDSNGCDCVVLYAEGTEAHMHIDTGRGKKKGNPDVQTGTNKIEHFFFRKK